MRPLLATALLLLPLTLACGDDSAGGDDAGPGATDAGPAGGADAGPGGADAGPAEGVPDVFEVEFETTAGTFVVQATRAWSPNGVDRFHELVSSGYYDGNKFFRVVPGFVVQFGISGDPAVSATWRDRRIPDDPVVMSNLPYTVSYAKPGSPDSRTTQLFINYADNSALDAMGFSTIGIVTSGTEAVDAINPEYGQTPDQGRIHAEGDAYLDAAFPNLDGIVTARIR